VDVYGPEGRYGQDLFAKDLVVKNTRLNIRSEGLDGIFCSRRVNGLKREDRDTEIAGDFSCRPILLFLIRHLPLVEYHPNDVVPIF